MQVAEVSQGKKVTGQMPSDKLDLTIIKADYRAQPRENLITDVAHHPNAILRRLKSMT